MHNSFENLQNKQQMILSTSQFQAQNKCNMRSGTLWIEETQFDSSLMDFKITLYVYGANKKILHNFLLISSALLTTVIYIDKQIVVVDRH